MLEKIMKLFKIHFSSNLTLKDGTPLYLNGSLDNGVQIFVITEDGNVALPDGEYQMEDETILLVKEGLIFDIIKPGVEETSIGNELSEEKLSEEVKPEIAEEVVIKLDEEQVNEIVTQVVEELGQKGNPEVSGEDVVGEDPMMEPDESDSKMAELEMKVSDLESKISEILSKLNLITEKFSAASPIIKKKEVENYQPNFSQDILDKVEMIKKLRKS